MQPLPHHYQVKATADSDGPVILNSSGLLDLSSAPPPAFDGPGDLWSPETLFVGAVCDCFVLTFRAIAKAAKLAWTNLECAGEGTLNREEGSVRFTGIDLYVQLEVSNPAEKERALMLLERSEKGCLISNSLRRPPVLHAQVLVKQAA